MLHKENGLTSEKAIRSSRVPRCSVRAHVHIKHGHILSIGRRIDAVRQATRGIYISKQNSSESLTSSLPRISNQSVSVGVEESIQ